MMNMGMKFSEELVEGMIRDVDVDGDGFIDYEEFGRIMASSHS